MGFARMTGHPCLGVCSPSKFSRLRGLPGTLPFGALAADAEDYQEGFNGGALLWIVSTCDLTAFVDRCACQQS
jgi:hypothetical protein